jgi:hypothetical protein
MKPIRTILLSVSAIAIVAWATSVAPGAIVVFDNQTDFITATGATVAADMSTATLGNKGTSYTLNDLTFTAGDSIIIGDWTNHLSGNDLAISGVENLDVSINLAGEFFSFGFAFVEPEFDANVNAPFVDSTFTVSLFSGATLVDSFQFNAPNDQAAFVGVWSTSDSGFDKIAIVETVGGNENEFFGDFFVGSMPVPEPTTLAIWGTLGGLGLIAARRRKRAA